MSLEPNAPVRIVMYKKFIILANLLYEDETFTFDEIDYDKEDMVNWARYAKDSSVPICGWRELMTKANQIYKLVKDR